MTSENNLLLPKVAETPAGKEVLRVLGSELSRTGDITKAYDAAAKVAQANGSIFEFQVAIVADLAVIFTRIMPLFLNQFKKP